MNAMGTGAKLTFVVVPVTIGVVAFPINTPVFFIAQVKAERKEVRQRLVSKPARWFVFFHIDSTKQKSSDKMKICFNFCDVLLVGMYPLQSGT